MDAFKAEEDAVLISIRLSPRASRDAIRGIREGALKIAVTSPPVENEANEHLVRLVAKKLSVPRSNVEIVKGQTSRNKLLRVTGITAEEAERCLLG